MSAQLSNALREAAYVVPAAELFDIVGRIRDLARNADNYNTTREAAALNNHQRNRPAYWTIARYSDAAACRLCDLAHAEGLDKALEQLVDEDWPAGLRSRARLLTTILPLNDFAKREKAEAVANSVKGAA